MDLPLIIAISCIISFFLILICYQIIKKRFEKSFTRWQEEQSAYWQAELEASRKQAVKQSRAVLGGKFTEQMAPYLPEFNYDPTEARFIGNPIDFVVFPGLATGNPKEIIIMEIKSGSSQLTSSERKIQNLVENGMIRWEVIRRDASNCEEHLEE